MMPQAPPLFVLAAGGTGGHVFPAEALASALLARGAKPVLFTDRRGGGFGDVLDSVDIYRLRAGGIAGLAPWTRLRNIVELALGFVQARRRLKRLLPQAVVGFGGYASMPTVMAACLSGFRTIVHEQNAVLGRANRLLAPRVTRIATSFETVARLPERAGTKVVRTGMPVRPPFAAARAHAYAPPQDHDPVRLLVLGGSQGARVFSEVVPIALGRLAEDLKRRVEVSQQCRPETLETVRKSYNESGIRADLAVFFCDVPDRLAAAHLVIARAGASTVAEVTAVGRPAILVPYPFATDDHQAANAEAVAASGAAIAISQDQFSAEALVEQLHALLGAPERLAAMAERARAVGAPDAGARLADLVIATAESTPALPVAQEERA